MNKSFEPLPQQDSPPSEERMDTASENLSNDTPNSTLSSDYDEPNQVLRLQDPLGHEHPFGHENPLGHEIPFGHENPLGHDDGLTVTKAISTLTIDRPKNLGKSPPKLTSALTTTTDHPLMGATSPETMDNYPDLIPKVSKSDDKWPVLENGGLYDPKSNTSKNNLYFSDAFVTAEGSGLDDLSRIDGSCVAPDVAMVSRDSAKRRIKVERLDDSPLTKNTSTPIAKRVMNINIPSFRLTEEEHSTPLQSPPSSPSNEDRSLCARIDPLGGTVTLRHKGQLHDRNDSRRKIQVPKDLDTTSIDSLSDASLGSEEDPPPPVPDQDLDDLTCFDDDDVSKRNTASSSSEPIPEYSLAEERREERGWLRVALPAGGEAVCDMKVIEPFKRVLSHGGYTSEGEAIIVLSACYLPHPTRTDYGYVMDNLMLYVIWSLERLVTEQFVLVYLIGAGSAPSLTTAREGYRLIDRRLKKSVKRVYLVHPNFWVRSLLLVFKPFISSKFYRKLVYVRNLKELAIRLPVEQNAIPEVVKNYDSRLS